MENHERKKGKGKITMSKISFQRFQYNIIFNFTTKKKEKRKIHENYKTEVCESIDYFSNTCDKTYTQRFMKLQNIKYKNKTLNSLKNKI